MNETEYDNGDYGEPYSLKGLVVPTNDIIEIGGGFNTQGNTDDIKFNSDTTGVVEITQNTKIWIKKKPNPDLLGTDYTHEVTGRSSTANGMFVTIHCRSVSGNVPIV